MNNNEEDDGAWKLIEVFIIVVVFVVLFSLLYRLMLKWGWVVL